MTLDRIVELARSYERTEPTGRLERVRGYISHPLQPILGTPRQRFADEMDETAHHMPWGLLLPGHAGAAARSLHEAAHAYRSGDDESARKLLSEARQHAEHSRMRGMNPGEDRLMTKALDRIGQHQQRLSEVPGSGRALVKLTASLDPEDVNYRPSEDPYTRCGTCDMFIPDAEMGQAREANVIPRLGSCSLVRGLIDPRDVCDRFEPRTGNGPLMPLTGSSLDLISLAWFGGGPKEEKQVKGYVKHGALGKLEEVKPHEEKYGAVGSKTAPFEKTQGFMIDALGHEHWGWYGAAGVLVHHTDEHGVTRYLLQKRAAGVQLGGTYSTPGGAIDAPGGIPETPEAAAFRELHEEMGGIPKDLTVTGVSSDHHGEPGQVGHWAYHTVSMASPEMFKPTSAKGAHGWENAGYTWVTPEEMANLPLHPGFTATAVKLGMPPPPPKQPQFKVGEHVWHSKAHKGAVVTKIREPELYQAPTYEVKYDSGTPDAGVAEEQHLSPFSAQKSLSQGTSRKLPDDYPAGSEVTWRYQGTTVEGKVTGPSEEKDSKGWPAAYHIEMKDGTAVKVPWGQLRPKSWSDPAPKPGPVKPAAGTGRLKVESALMPGLRMEVPASVQGKPVIAVYEHKDQPGSVVLYTGMGHASPYSFKEKRAGAEQTATHQALKAAGFVEARIASSGAQGPSHSSPLGKVVAAHEETKPKPIP